MYSAGVVDGDFRMKVTSVVIRFSEVGVIEEFDQRSTGSTDRQVEKRV
jgi:hypothetical protein